MRVHSTSKATSWEIDTQRTYSRLRWPHLSLVLRPAFTTPVTGPRPVRTAFTSRLPVNSSIPSMACSAGFVDCTSYMTARLVFK